MKNIFGFWLVLSFCALLQAQTSYNLSWSLPQLPFFPPQTGSEVAMVKGGFDTDNDNKGEFMISFTDLDSNYILMYEATGNDTYELVWYWEFPVKCFTFASFEVADLDNNGKSEIVVTLPSMSDIIPNPPRIWVFEWNGVQGENKYGNYSSGSLEAHLTWNFNVPDGIDFRPYSLIAEDVDKDGQQELIVGIRQGARGREVIVTSVTGEISGFASFDIEYNLQGLTGGGLYNVTTGDLDNDGKNEIYAMVWNKFSLFIIESTGANQYQLVDSLKEIYATDYGTVDGLRIADIDGNGSNELYIAATEPDNTVFVISNITDVANITANDVKVLMNIPVIAFGKLRTLWIDDMDGDGKKSLMIGGESNGQIFDVEYKGTGDPSLAASWDVNVAFDAFVYSGIAPTATPTISPRFFYGCPTGDMDRDGKKEYAFINYSTDFAVWANDSYAFIIENSAVSDVNENGSVPDNYNLSQNFPNPFNPSTTISYSLPKAGVVKLSVFNLLGQEVASLVDDYKAAGSYNVNFNAKGLSSGVYIYRLQVDGVSISKTLTLMK